MTPLGWFMMLLSITAVLWLVSYCFYKVLTLPPEDVEEHLRGQPAIDTQDTKNAD